MKHFESVWTCVVVVIATKCVVAVSNQTLSHHSHNFVGNDFLLRGSDCPDDDGSCDDSNESPFDIHNFNDHTKFKVCEKMLWTYAEAAANFSRCIVKYSRPIRICEWCIKHYTFAIGFYSNITQSPDCKEVLLQADRVQIIEHINVQTASLWKTSNCDNCFGSDRKLNEDVVKFNRLCNDTKECISRNNGTTCKFDAIKNASLCSAAACQNCTSSYEKLSKFYKELVKKYTMENLCMDVVDMMNTTRKIWSNSLDCVSFNNDIVVLFTLVTFVCLFPIFFYLGSWIQSDEQKSKIVPQKRLASTRSAAHLSLN